MESLPEPSRSYRALIPQFHHLWDVNNIVALHVPTLEAPIWATLCSIEDNTIIITAFTRGRFVYNDGKVIPTPSRVWCGPEQRSIAFHDSVPAQ